MKSRLRLIGIILLVMIIALSAAACAKNPFVGTWTGNYSGIPLTVVFTDKTVTMYAMGETNSGTYTRSGNTANIVLVGDTDSATVNGNTLTIASVDGVTFTRQ